MPFKKEFSSVLSWDYMHKVAGPKFSVFVEQTKLFFKKSGTIIYYIFTILAVQRERL